MTRPTRIARLSLAVTALFLLAFAMLGMSAKAKDQPEQPKPAEPSATTPDDSWVDTPGASVGAAVVFRDCRHNGEGEGGPRPIPMHKGGVRGSYLMESKSAEMPAAKPTGNALEAPAPPKPEQPQKRPEQPKAENSIYLSNDDSMSLSSAQRIEYAIRNFLPIFPDHLRPYEFLNYYKFPRNPVEEGQAFSVLAEMAPGLMRDQSTLALSVGGKKVSKEERAKAVMTFILDQSGSMNEADKMTYLKRGLGKVWEQFKPGDVINVVQFNHDVCVPLEGFVVGRDDKALFDKTIDYLRADGSTNLHDGLVNGYDLASRFHDAKKNNRVIMVTDAIANTGVVDKQLSATVTRHYDRRKIAFSGIGVGHSFNDAMLDELTDQGRGAYLFLASESAIDRVFGDKFVSLLDVVARDVHFKLTLPDSLRMDVFYGEESSTKKEEVQAIHYFANSSQLFLSDLKGEPKEGDTIRLDIEFSDPESGEARSQSFEWKATEILKKDSAIIDKARLILSLTDLIGETSPFSAMDWPCVVFPCYRKKIGPLVIMPPPPRGRAQVDTAKAAKACDHYRKKMDELAAGLKDDAEVRHIFMLQEQYCARFEKR